MNNDTVIVEQIYNAPVGKVWASLTEITLMKQWYFPQLESFTPVAGFETSFNVHHEGNDFLHLWKVKAVEVNKHISYEWKYGGFPGNSLISFDLTPEKDKTKLVITHSKLASFEGHRYPALSAENFRKGWESFAGKLAEFLRESIQSIQGN